MQVFSVHPGVVATNFFRHVPIPQFVAGWVKKLLLEADEGAESTLVALFDEGLKGNSGTYLDEYGLPQEPNKLVQEEKLREELWDRSLVWAELLPRTVME